VPGLLACLLLSAMLGIAQLPRRVSPSPFVLVLGPAAQLRGSRIAWSCADFPSPSCDHPFYAIDLIWADHTGYRVVTFIEFPLSQE